jgi:RNA polymerase sigma-70 factor (ECF subfamily)
MDRRLNQRLDASDVVQEALVDATRKLDDYAQDPPLPFYNWLKRLAFERIADARRRHIKAAARTVCREAQAEPGLSGSSHKQLIDRLAAKGSSASEVHRRQESRQQVSQALQGLREIDRNVLVLRYLKGLSFSEVAAVLEISENAAKVRHYRAMIQVRKLMEEASLK